MSTELIHTLTDKTLRYAQAGLPSGIYKILIPKGTHLWRVGITTYLSDEPAYAIASFDAEPVEPGVPLGPDTRNTLERLWSGSTLTFDSPPRSGTLSISAPESTSTFRSDRDRWLYLRISFPSGKALNFTSQIDLYESPVVRGPVPDLDVAIRALGYANQSGLVDVLRRMANASTDEQLVDWVLAQNGLWPAICKTVELAEKSK